MLKIKTFLYLILSSVSLIGLISCNEDVVNVVEDQYQVDEAKIVNSSGQEEDLLIASGLDNIHLPNDQIKVDWTNTLEVQIKTNCQSGGNKFTTERLFHSGSKISLLNLLPSEVFAEGQIKESKCHISLNSKSINGSTDIQNFPNVIVDLKSVENKVLVLAGKNHLRTTNTLSIDENELNRLYFYANDVAFDKVTLYCTNFKLNSKSPTWPMAFEDFEWWTIDKKKLTGTSQGCRIIATNSEVISGLSKNFTIKLQQAKATYLAKETLQVPKAGANKSTLVSVEVKNNDSRAMHFRIANITNSPITYEVFTDVPLVARAYFTSQTNLNLDINNKSKARSINGYLYFSVAPKSKATLNISAMTPYYCRQNVSNTISKPNAWGMGIKWQKIYHVEQLEDQTTSSKVIGKFILNPNIQEYVDIDGVNRWTKTYADIKKNVKHTKTLSCQVKSHGTW